MHQKSVKVPHFRCDSVIIISVICILYKESGKSVKIEQLEQLIKIVESGSMNIAAREMYVARSSLSTSMKHLEA